MPYLSYEPRKGTDDVIDSEPFIDALREGYLVGQAAGVQIVINPLEYDSDPAAIQDAHDRLIEELEEYGHGFNGNGILWIPALKPDDTQWVIDETVTFHWEASSRSGVYPRGWGFTGRQGPAIQLAIDDGSPAFHVRRMQGQGSWLGGMRAEGASGGEDCEFLRLHRITAFHIDKIGMRGFGGPQANGVITFDSGCYNSFINNVRYNGGNEDVSGSNLFAFRDLEETGDAPGELHFGDGNSTYSPSSDPYKNAFDLGNEEDFTDERDSTPGDIVIRGRYEGYGEHCVFGEVGALMLADGLEIGDMGHDQGEPIHRLYFTGHRLVVSDGVRVNSRNATDGPEMYINVRRGKIGSFMDGDQDTTALQVEDRGSNRLVVPREHTFQADVDYPEEFNQLVYTDGWQRDAHGTVTVPVGESVILSRWVGRGSSSVRVRTDIADSDQYDNDELWYTVQKGRTRSDHASVRIVDETDEDQTDVEEYDVHYVIESISEREAGLVDL